MAAQNQIEEKREGGILELGLKLNENNRFSRDGLLALGETLDRWKRDEAVRVLIFTSAVPGYFSNGLDPALFVGKSLEEARAGFRLITETAAKFCFFPVPTICVISGHCMAAGAAMAIGADFRLMAEKGARIGFPETAIAMNYPSFSAGILCDLVGTTNARDLLYFAKLLKGPEALAMGLVDEICPASVLHDRALKLAGKLAALPPAAARGIKESLRRRYADIEKQTRDYDIEQMARTSMTADAQEGFRSLAERRRPATQA